VGTAPLQIEREIDMKNIRIVTRADDAGSSHSANLAIRKVVQAGIIKNVSVMAPGRYVNEAAQLLAGNKNVCFGMHATINAEWAYVKWGPVSDLPRNCGLLDEKGMFLPSPQHFEKTHPPIECILKEYDAQLDKLSREGFNISYVDSHMFPEMSIPELDGATAQWAREKGLLDHMYYYILPPGIERALKDPKQIVPMLRNIPEGQYFYVTHPSLNTAEMRMTGHDDASGKRVARNRGLETAIFSSKLTKVVLDRLGIQTLRYSKAVPSNLRGSAEFISRLMNGG